MMSPLRITVRSWRAGGTGKLPSFQLTPTHIYFYGFKENRAVAMRDRRAGPRGTEADLKQFAITSLRFREATSGRLIRPLLHSAYVIEIESLPDITHAVVTGHR